MNTTAAVQFDICSGRRALVVDDDATSRAFLKSLLIKLGYHVTEARNGAEGVERFEEGRHDIVFLDVQMPVMDGYDAAERIKWLSQDEFVPIIFLTSNTDEVTLARSVEAGGDDFLTKPCNPMLLVAKIAVLERIRDLHRQVNAANEHWAKEQEIAKRVFSKAVVADNVAMERLGTRLQAAKLFNGDVLLTAYAPSGDFHVLLGDATGHGLAAALGAIPASGVFRTMTAKGFSGAEILNAINLKLHTLLPPDMFMATQFVSLDRDLSYVSVCNCGMPDVLVLNAGGEVRARVPSRSPPLGVLPHVELGELIDRIAIDPGDRVLLFSDGVIEAQNHSGELFGEKRLEAALTTGARRGFILDAVTEALDAFCADALQQDDISAVEIPCVPDLVGRKNPGVSLLRPEPSDGQFQSIVETTAGWSYSLELTGPRLRRLNPIPLILNEIQEMEGDGPDRQVLFTILTELYVNALDHGVLGLKSSLKHCAEGFQQYFEERERRLQNLKDGYVSVSLESRRLVDRGTLLIKIEDSGSGFDYAAYFRRRGADTLMYGRGIELVSGLCESLTYREPCNLVEAVYSWER